MCALYAVTAPTILITPDGTTTWATVSAQSKLRAAPAWAAPISAAPYGNGTSTESPRAPGIPLAISAQLLLTVKRAGRGGAPGTRPFLIAQYVEPWLKNGIAVTFATPMSTPPCGDAPTPRLSSSESYRALNTAVGVTSVESPPFTEFVAAPSTSLLPIQTVTKVGSAFRIICTCVSPPRKNCVSVLARGATFSYTSLTSAPGTAVLLMKGGGTDCVRRK